LNIRYCADNWLYIQSYSFAIDGKTYSFAPTEIKRDNGEGIIWEWSSDVLDKNTYEIVKAVVGSKSTKIRFRGKLYTEDKLITDEQKHAMKNVLEAYQVLGGGFSFLKP
jgi:hypothetical protein